MYYKLPIKDRMDLMKSYKKANKDMSYSDMVNDYNTSYQKFKNGGEKPWGEMNAKERTAYLDAKEVNAKAETTSRKQATKEHYQDYVKDSMKKTLEHPMFNTAQYFTPEGMAIGAIKGLANIGPDVAKGDYSAAAFDALTALPAVAPAVKNVYNISKLPKFNNVSKSEIDWKAWNKEIPENKALMNEYNAIEETSKAKGTWMKNPDGSAFEGTPEQFVQVQSENFRKAFPQGYDKVLRGDRTHYEAIRGKGEEFYDKPIFTSTNKELAKDFAYKGPTTSPYYNSKIETIEQKLQRVFGPDMTVEKLRNEHPEVAGRILETNDGGLYELAIPKTKNELSFNAGNRAHYSLSNPEVYDKLIKEGIIPYKRPELGIFDTNDIGKFVEKNGLDRATIKNIDEGVIGDVIIHNQRPGQYAKSLRGNNGMFDMTNPNIYKSVVPIGLGAAALQQETSKDKHKYGGIQRFDDGGEFDDDGSIIKNMLSKNTLAKGERPIQDNTRVSNLPIKTLQALQQQANVEKAAKQQYKQQPVISQGRKLNPSEQAYSDKVQARIANPSNDLGIIGANMASALTRLRYLNPEEIAATTNNPMGTVGLSSNIMTEALANEMAGPAFGKGLTSSAKAIKASKESGILSNAYKYNPKAYANVDSKLPNFLQLNKNQLKNKYLRQTGKPQYEDFLKEGKLYGLGQKEFMEKFGKDAWDDAYNKSVNFKGFNVEKAAPSNFFGKEKLFFPATRKPTGKGYKGTANSDAEYLFETKLPDNAFVNQYQQKYIKGEIPSGGTATLKPVYGFNDAENFNLYKKDWLQGYKSIKK